MINWGIIGFGNMGKQYFNCLQKKSSIFNLTAVASQSKKGVNKLSKDIKFFKISLWQRYLRRKSRQIK